MSSRAKWTFMVYMAGDNNLSAAGDNDLDEMRIIGSTADVNVLVQFDNAGNHGTTRYLVKKTGKDIVQQLGETDSGDPNVLLDFVSWAHGNYPADRYALVLWNHGGGWAPSEIDTIAQEVRARGYSDREGVMRSGSSLRRAFFRPTLETILSLDSPQERAICSDDGSSHSLDTVELGKVLKKIKRILDRKLDLLGMDACLTSNLEVAYQAHPHVKYMVASEENEPNDGWPYQAVLSQLVNSPDLSTVEFANHIVHAYVQSYMEMGYNGDVTQTALDLDRITPLNAALNLLADALITNLPSAALHIWSAQRRSKRFWHNTLIDVGSFSAEISNAMSDQATTEAAEQILKTLQSGSDSLVTAEAHHGFGVSACTGLTIYLPSPLSGVSRYYKDLDFARTQRWPEMLQAYMDS